MIGTSSAFTVDFRMRKFFLDRVEVERKIGKLKAKALTRGGAFVRQAARKLLGPPSTRPARPPGQPPRVHSADERASLRNVLFYYDARNDSVIIGPVHLNQVQQSAIDLGRYTVPELMEGGGTVNIQEISKDKGKTWRRRDLRRNPRQFDRLRTRRATYPARPFMGPALKKTLQRVPDLFGSSAINDAA